MEKKHHRAILITTTTTTKRILKKELIERQPKWLKPQLQPLRWNILINEVQFLKFVQFRYTSAKTANNFLPSHAKYIFNKKVKYFVFFLPNEDYSRLWRQLKSFSWLHSTTEITMSDQVMQQKPVPKKVSKFISKSQWISINMDFNCHH